MSLQNSKNNITLCLNSSCPLKELKQGPFRYALCSQNISEMLYVVSECRHLIMKDK